MFQELICQLFSNECQLISLRLDLSCCYENLNLHHCFKPFDDISTYSPYCLTLRYLYIHLDYAYFLEHLVEHVPFLGKLCVSFKNSLNVDSRSSDGHEVLSQSNGSWFNKVRQIIVHWIGRFCDR